MRLPRIRKGRHTRESWQILAQVRHCSADKGHERVPMDSDHLAAMQPCGDSQEPAAALRYVARQPILDGMGRVHAYELLFRSGPETCFRGDGELATCTMIDNTVLFGLEKLTGGLPAFVNCTADVLKASEVGVLPASMTVLEILEDIEPLPDLIAACRRLKSEGYRLALDDFVWKPSMEPLIRLADFIKIDFVKSPEAARKPMLKHLEGFSGALLAEKVETREEYDQARAEGFTLFQGYYFCRPTLMTSHKVPANKMVHVQLLQMLQENPLDVPKISEIVKRDASLTFRLLRLVNSPAYAVRQEVRSIPTALVTLGDDLIRRIATVAIACELNVGQPKEILRMAFVRGRFCELTSELCSFDPMEQYLLGIFSLLPAMLHSSMQEIALSLPLRDEVREALLGKTNDIRCPLLWLESHERGDWDTCDQIAKSHGQNAEQLQKHFTEAVQWADQVLPANG